MKTVKILGLSAYYHDSSAALIIDGEVVAAAQEERFTRKKFDSSFPEHSIRFCLNKAGISLDDLDEIVYYEKPFLSFERLLQTIMAKAPATLLTFLSSMPIWMREKLNTRSTLEKSFKRKFLAKKLPPVTFSQHHLSHAASAFYPSPFETAAILCLDGVGEWATTSAWVGRGEKIESLWQIDFPHSLGLFYSAFTSFCGFKVNSGEYKLMGLAPFGTPRYVDEIKKNLIDIKDDGSYRLNMKYFGFASSLSMTNRKFAQLFKLTPRDAEGPMPQEYKDLAASVQKVTEEIMLKLARTLKTQTGAKHLCLAGGVALNCVANGLIAREKVFEKIWIQPAAGDAGGSLGAALASYYLQHHRPRQVNCDDSMKRAFLGPAYSSEQIQDVLLRYGLVFEKLTPAEKILKAATQLENQRVMGWFQGAMEYGPRSLGARSIIADPRSPTMQSRMNLKIKFRESFRPFAPIVRAERVQDVYKENFLSPYMLLVTHVNDEWKHHLPAVTHLDGSARLQTVEAKFHPLLHQLLSEFDSRTGCPALVNTSFNVRGEPIVCTPLDALRCFINTDIDDLFLEDFYLAKEKQTAKRTDDIWKQRYELD